jgi:Pyruvate/2-oxoacid:ferredoxin oxidoreductase delta subunit
MVVRKILEIDEDACNGCGVCIPNCPEGAIQIIDEKARLISDIFCDGLGACLGKCPEDAITIIEREAEPYSEWKVMENMVKQGMNVVKAHLSHLKDHGEEEFLREALDYLEANGYENPLEEDASDEGPAAVGDTHACAGSREMVIGDLEEPEPSSSEAPRARSELRQWPVQLNLVSPQAPFLKGKELLITADCVPIAVANFHQDYLKDRSVVIGCPKFDDAMAYLEKLTQIFTVNDIERVKLLHMEVPCCFGLKAIAQRAIEDSGKAIELNEAVISVQGEEMA